MVHKKIIAFLLIGLVLVPLIFIGACSKQETTTPTEEPAREHETTKPIVLRYGEQDPESHPNAGVTKMWLNKIENDSNGRVKFESYFGGTLITAGDSYNEIQNRVADVGKIIVDYVESGFDLHKVLPQFFIGISDPEAQVNIYRNLRSTFPEFEKEFEKVKNLNIVYAGSPYQLLTIKPVRSLEDLRGLQIKGTPAQINPFKEFGCSIISMSMFDVYPALEKGTIDGVIAPLDVLKSLNIAEVVNYCTTLDIPSYLHAGISMNWDVWNSLPPDIQKIFEENSQYYTEQLLRVDKESVQNSIEYAKELGVEFLELTEDELSRLHSVLITEAQKKAAELDAKGIPGTKIFEEAQRIINEQYN
mgnify:CR=1 FL=1